MPLFLVPRNDDRFDVLEGPVDDHGERYERKPATPIGGGHNHHQNDRNAGDQPERRAVDGMLKVLG